MKTAPGPREALLSQKQAEEILRPYHEKIANILGRAWESWQTHALMRPDTHAALSPLARAIYVRDECLRFAAEEFGDEVEIIDDQQAILFKVSDLLFLRFRKLGDNGLPRKGTTNHSLELNNGQLDLFIQVPSLVGKTYVIAGYMLDPAKVDMIDRRIVCMWGDDSAWSYSISDDLTFEAPEEITPPPTSPSRSKVVPIGIKKKDESGERIDE